MKFDKLAILVVVVLVVLGGGFLLLRGGQKTQEVQEFKPQAAQVAGNFVKGNKAPDVSFVDFEGETYKLSDFAGKAIVLDFWAGWCPFCIEEMPELQKAQDKHGDELVMVGVHRTDTESINTGLKFAKDLDVSYLLVSDADGSLYRAAGGFGMPVAVFIDKEGVVQEIKSGPKTTDEIEQKVAKLVE